MCPYVNPNTKATLEIVPVVLFPLSNVFPSAMYSHSKAMSKIPGKILWLGIKKMKKTLSQNNWASIGCKAG